MKVIDSFIFFNEVDMLKLRLNYLNEVVDHFVICECNYTHSGNKKPYYLDNIIRDIPKSISKKIIRLKYEPDISKFNFLNQEKDYTLENEYWKLERSHRNFITNNISQFHHNDLFILSDVDEIPSKESIKEHTKIFKENKNILPKNFSVVLKCKMFYYNLNTFCADGWCGSIITTVGNALLQTCDYLRYNRHSFYEVDNAGWHFSTFGNVQQIKTKIQSYAHQEYNKKEYISDENIITSIQNKEDIFHNSERFKDYDFQSLPEDLKKHIIDIFPEYLYKS